MWVSFSVRVTGCGHAQSGRSAHGALGIRHSAVSLHYSDAPLADGAFVKKRGGLFSRLYIEKEPDISAFILATKNRKGPWPLPIFLLTNCGYFRFLPVIRAASG